jgi:hypothetical protein
LSVPPSTPEHKRNSSSPQTLSSPQQQQQQQSQTSTPQDNTEKERREQMDLHFENALFGVLRCLSSVSCPFERASAIEIAKLLYPLLLDAGKRFFVFVT